MSFISSLRGAAEKAKAVNEARAAMARAEKASDEFEASRIMAETIKKLASMQRRPDLTSACDALIVACEKRDEETRASLVKMINEMQTMPLRALKGAYLGMMLDIAQKLNPKLDRAKLEKEMGLK